MGGKKTIHRVLNYLIACVWIVNGLFCKLLNFVPRHQLIVSEIAGEEYSFLFSKLIGIAEILMAAWILSSIRSRFCAIVQVIVVATMNIIEYCVCPGLLLFGKMNAIVALFFITVIVYNEFVLNKNPAR